MSYFKPGDHVSAPPAYAEIGQQLQTLIWHELGHAVVVADHGIKTVVQFWVEDGELRGFNGWCGEPAGFPRAALCAAGAAAEWWFSRPEETQRCQGSGDYSPIIDALQSRHIDDWSKLSEMDADPHRAIAAALEYIGDNQHCILEAADAIMQAAASVVAGHILECILAPQADDSVLIDVGTFEDSALLSS